jgi:hypothetical protein
MSVFSRLWLWGAISWNCNEALITPVIEQVRAAAVPGKPILFAVDGFKAYVSSILKVFRDPLYTGKRGRPRLLVRDEFAPSWWTLADAAGNEADIATTKGRD